MTGKGFVGIETVAHDLCNIIPKLFKVMRNYLYKFEILIKFKEFIFIDEGPTSIFSYPDV